MFTGCKPEIEYKYITKEGASRPAFYQVFAFFTVDDETIDWVKMIYDKMTDEELVDLKYNYYSPVPIFGVSNNAYNPQNTIEYKGNAIYIRGSVDANNFEGLFRAALGAYKNDIVNQLLVATS